MSKRWFIYGLHGAIAQKRATFILIFFNLYVSTYEEFKSWVYSQNNFCVLTGNVIGAEKICIPLEIFLLEYCNEI
jgi:hypothetical protein